MALVVLCVVVVVDPDELVPMVVVVLPVPANSIIWHSTVVINARFREKLN